MDQRLAVASRIIKTDFANVSPAVPPNGCPRTPLPSSASDATVRGIPWAFNCRHAVASVASRHVASNSPFSPINRAKNIKFSNNSYRR